ncbi:MAG: DUF2520 domain-containing protein [Bacteroidales bacterium]|nr:DUF2520 domain-containing protein [Bacteroidales bacterium]
MIEKVTLIGSGNMAHWLVYAMRNAGVRISQVYSRQLGHAKALAEMAGAEAIDNIKDLLPDSDLYIFSIKDDSYENLLQQLPFRLSLAAHTAGSLSMRIFEPYAESYGILYPYQSVNKNMDFKNVVVPLCVEANDKAIENELFVFAHKLTSVVQKLDESQRMVLHRAAIFGCNFTNAMYSIAYDILQEHHIDWQMIMPLLQNTMEKVKTMNPHQAQTGPAQRGDQNVIQFHLDALQDELLKDIYRVVTDYITIHSN